jgi:hypothetical protein
VEPPHFSAGQRRTQERIFAGTFHHATPARVAGNVDHRGEGPMHAAGRRFNGRRASGPLCQVGVPGRGFCQRHGKYGTKPVDHIKGKQQRYMQARTCDDVFLQPASPLETVDAEDRTNGVHGQLRQFALVNDGAGRRVLDAELVELANFFFECHLLQQALDGILLAGVESAAAETERQVAQCQFAIEPHGRLPVSAVEGVPIAVDSELKGWY